MNRTVSILILLILLIIIGIQINRYEEEHYHNNLVLGSYALMNTYKVSVTKKALVEFLNIGYDAAKTVYKKVFG